MKIEYLVHQLTDKT